MLKRGAGSRFGPSPPDRESWDLIEFLLENIEEGLEGIRFVPAEGHVSTQSKLHDDGLTGERRDAVAFLKQWALDPNGQPYCALLGEYGMGKTTTSMAFARELLGARGHRTPGAGDTSPSQSILTSATLATVPRQNPTC